MFITEIGLKVQRTDIRAHPPSHQKYILLEKFQIKSGSYTLSAYFYHDLPLRFEPISLYYIQQLLDVEPNSTWTNLNTRRSRDLGMLPPTRT